MIKVFYGENRAMARKAIDKLLGKDYEIVEAENLTTSDMPSVFLGTSLFGEKRKILVKSLSENKECYEMLPKYVDECPHDVVIWEEKIDKRSVTYKVLAKSDAVEFKEFAAMATVDKNLVFEVFNEAYRGNSRKAIELCDQIAATNDPFQFIGLMTTLGAKKLQFDATKATKTMKAIAEADMNMKIGGIEPWTAVKIALIKIGGR